MRLVGQRWIWKWNLELLGGKRNLATDRTSQEEKESQTVKIPFGWSMEWRVVVSQHNSQKETV